ncbi:MAG TPA: DUF6614 family protein [Candidatus Thermoplasmatota archaeon]|nr:DUF6614 family protein [Candidatus Thermoplasmatota archaeon]
MDYYQIWVDIRESRRDVEFAQHVARYLGHLKEKGLIEGHMFTRRKLGFGPDALGEFNITIMVKDMAQLERTFQYVATRGPPIEPLHAAVFSMVTDFTAALYRDFPDAVRMPAPP